MKITPVPTQGITKTVFLTNAELIKTVVCFLLYDQYDRYSSHTRSITIQNNNQSCPDLSVGVTSHIVKYYHAEMILSYRHDYHIDVIADGISG